MRVYAYGAKAPVEEAQLTRVWAQMHGARRYQNRLVEIERARREKWLAGREKQDAAAQEAADAEADVAVKLARASCGVYWGSYLLVEDAVQRAKKSGGVLHFARWDGSGTIGVQLQGGLKVAELMKNEDSRLRLEGEGKYRRVWIRVGSEGRAPIWAVFPFKYHRDLPPDAIMKWARVHAHRVGTHTRWSVQFVLDNAPNTLPAPTRGAIAIDVGWRRVEEGLRVATWVDDEGRSGTLVLPEQLEDRMAKIESLRAIRDSNFNVARDFLKDHKARVPALLQDRLVGLHAWKAPGRLAALMIAWRTQREAGDEDVFDHLEGWRKQDKHLLEWEANQRENVLAARRDLYRTFAKHVVGQYSRIIIEALDLRDFAEKPTKDEPKDTPIQANARPNRHFAALSTLITTMKDVAVRSGADLIEAEPAWTTQTCHVCQAPAPFDAATQLTHTCTACNATWDQDLNAAHNLLRAARSAPAQENRSRKKKPNKTGRKGAREATSAV